MAVGAVFAGFLRSPNCAWYVYGRESLRKHEVAGQIAHLECLVYLDAAVLPYVASLEFSLPLEQATICGVEVATYQPHRLLCDVAGRVWWLRSSLSQAILKHDFFLWCAKLVPVFRLG